MTAREVLEYFIYALIDDWKGLTSSELEVKINWLTQYNVPSYFYYAASPDGSGSFFTAEDYLKSYARQEGTRRFVCNNGIWSLSGEGEEFFREKFGSEHHAMKTDPLWRTVWRVSEPDTIPAPHAPR